MKKMPEGDRFAGIREAVRQFVCRRCVLWDARPSFRIDSERRLDRRGHPWSRCQVVEYEAVTRDRRPRRDRNRLREHRSGTTKSVKFATLATGVHAGRKRM